MVHQYNTKHTAESKSKESTFIHKNRKSTNVYKKPMFFFPSPFSSQTQTKVDCLKIYQYEKHYIYLKVQVHSSAVVLTCLSISHYIQMTVKVTNVSRFFYYEEVILT